MEDILNEIFYRWPDLKNSEHIIEKVLIRLVEGGGDILIRLWAESE